HRGRSRPSLRKRSCAGGPARGHILRRASLLNLRVMFALTRSMLGLIVASFLLVSAPLIAAVVSSFVNVTGLSRQADEALARGVEIAQLSQAVVAEIHGMERNVRQYSVLGDADFLKFYQDRQQRLETNVARLEQLVGANPATAQLE